MRREHWLWLHLVQHLVQWTHQADRRWLLTTSVIPLNQEIQLECGKKRNSASESTEFYSINSRPQRGLFIKIFLILNHCELGEKMSEPQLTSVDTKEAVTSKQGGESTASLPPVFRIPRVKVIQPGRSQRQDYWLPTQMKQTMQGCTQRVHCS